MNGRIRRIEKEKIDLFQEIGMLENETTVLRGQVQSHG
jgi:hypothetical protein